LDALFLGPAEEVILESQDVYVEDVGGKCRGLRNGEGSWLAEGQEYEGIGVWVVVLRCQSGKIGTGR
jgi:hypothetical protein